MTFGSCDKWVGLCISNHFCKSVVVNKLLAYILTLVIFIYICSLYFMVCIETSLYLTKGYYCFVKHINSQTLHFTSCDILKGRELTKPAW